MVHIFKNIKIYTVLHCHLIFKIFILIFIIFFKKSYFNFPKILIVSNFIEYLTITCYLYKCLFFLFYRKCPSSLPSSSLKAYTPMMARVREAALSLNAQIRPNKKPRLLSVPKPTQL